MITWARPRPHLVSRTDEERSEPQLRRGRERHQREEQGVRRRPERTRRTLARSQFTGVHVHEVE